MILSFRKFYIKLLTLAMISELLISFIILILHIQWNIKYWIFKERDLKSLNLFKCSDIAEERTFCLGDITDCKVIWNGLFRA